MDQFKKGFTKTIYILTALLAGLCIFTALTSSGITWTIMQPGFHEDLSEKNNLYNHVHDVANISMNDFIKHLKETTPESFEGHEDVFFMLENSITPEMVKFNLDSLRNGLFAYLNGDKMFLPDIHLNPQPDPNKTKDTGLSLFQTNAPQALTKIDKINLNTILLYINQSDLLDYLLALKLIYYLIKAIPGFSLLLMIFLFLAGFVLSKNVIQIVKWTVVCLASCATFTLLSGSLLAFYTYRMMPASVHALGKSIPLDMDVVISYFKDCLTPLWTLLVISGLLFLLLIGALFLISKKLPSTLYKKSIPLNSPSPTRRQIVFVNAVYTFLFILILSAIGFRVDAFTKDFELRAFFSVLNKLKTNNTVTHVIAAKDETIYSLQVKLVESSSGNPVDKVKFAVSGTSSKTEKSFDETLTTDALGSAKCTLDEGHFRLIFDSSDFPDTYQMPVPFAFDIKAAGTTVVTINLDPAINTQEWGVAEIEVLDSENQPIQGLGLELEGAGFAPGDPDKVYSYTNEEGIAVFKLYTGTHSIAFLKEDFPTDTLMPVPLQVIVQPNMVTRYSIRLVDAIHPASPSPTQDPLTPSPPIQR